MRELFRTLGLSQINSNNLKDYISYMRKSIRVSKQIYSGLSSDFRQQSSTKIHEPECDQLLELDFNVNNDINSLE